MAAGAATPSPQVLPGPMASPLANANEPGPSSPAWRRLAEASAGARGPWSEPPIAHGSVAGRLVPLHDGQWFDRIHVLPRTASVGYLAGDTLVEVEIWNAWRRGRTLTAINITGPDGVSVPGVTLPQGFAALQSRVHTVVIAISGGAELDNVVSWVFAAISSEGADLTLTGWRLVAFSIPPDGISAIQESFGYLTDVLASWDEHEQRRQLRAVPLYGLGYGFVCTEARDSQLLQALLYGQGESPYAVPLWQYANRLESVVGIGATALPVETDSVYYPDWMTTNLVLLWQDPHLWEVLPVSTVAPGLVTLAQGTARAWAAGRLVVPVAVGSLAGAPELARENTRIRSGKVAFRMTGVAG